MTIRLSTLACALLGAITTLSDCMSFAQMAGSRISPFGKLPAVARVRARENADLHQLSSDLWESIGPNGISVVSIAVDYRNPSVIYLGGYSGLYKTTNGGKLWGLVSDQFRDQMVTSITIHPNDPSTLFAKAYGAENSMVQLRLRKSTDAGATWFTLRTAPPYISYDEGVMIDPLNPPLMYTKLLIPT